jgi:hypothetical protein
MGAAEPQQWPEVPIQAHVYGQAVPLTIDRTCVATSEERYAHCEAAIKSGFPVICGLGNIIITDRPCVIVGSGLSAVPLLEEIRERQAQGHEIVAIKGAHDWLIENGIIPRAAVAMDPQRARAKCFKRRTKGVMYLLASQMHPATWDYMRGYQALIWHSRIGVEQEKREGWADRVIFPCCTTSGHSAMALLYVLGRRNFELYGFDSSFAPGQPLKINVKRTPAEKATVAVCVGARQFLTTAAMASQAAEIQPLFQRLPEVKVTAHGDGYYQALLAEGKAKGWPV